MVVGVVLTIGAQGPAARVSPLACIGGRAWRPTPQARASTRCPCSPRAPPCNSVDSPYVVVFCHNWLRLIAVCRSAATQARQRTCCTPRATWSARRLSSSTASTSPKAGPVGVDIRMTGFDTVLDLPWAYVGPSRLSVFLAITNTRSLCAHADDRRLH